MKKLLLVSALVLFGSASMYAAACNTFIGTSFNTIGTCTDTVLLGSGGTVTVTFSAFSDGGSGAVVAAIENNAVTGQMGFQLAGANQQTPLTPFTGLTYTATITSCTPGSFACTIFAQYQQASFGVPGNATGSVSFAADGCLPVPAPLTPSNSTLPATNCSAAIASGVGDTVTLNYTAGTNSLTGLESDVYVNAVDTTVPEPTAFILMGAGLGLVGLVRRKAARR
jgi:hypothetical protein